MCQLCVIVGCAASNRASDEFGMSPAQRLRHDNWSRDCLRKERLRDLTEKEKTEEFLKIKTIQSKHKKAEENLAKHNRDKHGKLWQRR